LLNLAKKERRLFMDKDVVQVTIPPTVVSDTLEGDTIVIDVTSGAYYTLSPDAGGVWQQVQDSGTVVLGVSDKQDSCLAELVAEGLLVSALDLGSEVNESGLAFIKYVDMQDLLLADPIHEVDESGWPMLAVRSDDYA